MTETGEAFVVLEQLEALEANPDSAQMIRSALDTLRSSGVEITFDTALSHLGELQNSSGASMFAALIVREHNRQRISEALAAAPLGTAH